MQLEDDEVETIHSSALDIEALLQEADARIQKKAILDDN